MKTALLSSSVSIVLLLSILLGTTVLSSPPDCPSTGYCHWADMDDDGDIDIFDIVNIAARYRTTGTPINKTALLRARGGELIVHDGFIPVDPNLTSIG